MSSSRFDLVIINGVVATAADCGSYCIGIKDGKIAALAQAFSPEEIGDAEVLDAEGAYVTPGGIDAHVHIAQDLTTGPGVASGATCADDFDTGSRSAVAGGTTTMVAFAMQTKEDPSLLQVVEDYHKRASDTGCWIDWSYHIIISRVDKDTIRPELDALVKDWGITSLKCFTTYDALRLSDHDLMWLMLEARRLGVTTMMHAESGDIIAFLTEKLEERGMTAPSFHGQSRLPIAEGEATTRAIVLAELVQTPVLFVHVSAASAADAIRAAQSRGLPIFAETCPQYLHLTHADLERFHGPLCFENSKMLCSPPPGLNDDDQEHLWTGLRNGTFTIYSSDHCPFSFKYVPNGCPGIETRLPLLFNYGLMTGRITPEKFVELTSTGAAKLYGMYPKKGALLPGLSDADITVWYPEGKLKPFKLTNEHLHHDVDYTPYEGMEFANWPRYTILRGKIMWKEGKLLGKAGDGLYMKRGESQLAKSPVGMKKDPRRVPLWLHDE
ncbi:putative aminohydrolase [Leucosporidium creatinivorum]|uniref:dihydropyrimidinase n=1 Tax=Leucosporidium creatinivorum TaxID=106004 RepID=A0A1Y2FEM6_9BASI|nr:putative aminohydrolase [Leucosporidium creatinivorum]